MSLASIAQTSGIIARSTNAGSLVWDGRSLLLRLLVTLLLAIGWAGAASAQDSSAAPAKIDGFRSAKFGMDKVEVLTAVRSDFDLRKSDVEQGINKAERTDLLSITVDNLLPEGGPARVTYIMGYRSKVLIHVNVAWGKLGGQSPSAESLVTAGNVLQNYFLQRGYPPEGITVNQPLPDGSVILFRATDEEGRQVWLRLLPDPERVIDESSDEEAPAEAASLLLSYIENPASPDAYRVKSGEF